MAGREATKAFDKPDSRRIFLNISKSSTGCRIFFLPVTQMGERGVETMKNNEKKGRIFLFLGAVSGFIGVAAGAFGAHILKDRLGADMVSVFEVGVRYQLYHALALMATAWVRSKRPTGLINTAGWCFAIGTMIFSGSLYLLALSGKKWFGAITPVGGLALLAGWACLAWAALKKRPL
jgi:uncharacterized membrane protein YgdD (TMEM256/DUF423 family)